MSKELSESVSLLPEALEAIALEIAGGMVGSLDQLVERWYERMAAVPQLVSWRRSDLRALILPHARVDIGRELAGLMDGRRLPSSCPDEVIESARLAATSGLPLWASLQVYRMGHAEQWRAWSEEVERRELNADDRRALLRAGSDYFFAYADRCMRWMELEYMRAREIPMRREEQRRVQLVRRILEGHDRNATEFGYDLSQWHLGLVVSGPGTDRLMDKMAERRGASMLAVAAEGSTAWAWIGMSSPPNEIRQWLSGVDPAEGTTLAVGDPELGTPGFRLTHVQAQIAAALGGRLGRGITFYGDVALEDLAGYNQSLAQRFVKRELGVLAADTREAQTLRDTLAAYFATSQRASSAAVRLGVHERTVGNRLRRVEHLLGGSVSTRRAELEVALRLHKLLAE